MNLKDERIVNEFGTGYFESHSEDKHRQKCGEIFIVMDSKCFIYQCKFCEKLFDEIREFNVHIESDHLNSDPLKINDVNDDDDDDYIHSAGPTEVETYTLHKGLNLIDESSENLDTNLTDNESLTEDNEQKRIDHELLTHTGEKPYRCQICGKRFLFKDAYENHKIHHKNSDLYKCNICNKASFATQFNLNKHIQRHKKKPNICTQCGKTFLYNCALRRHERVHTGEKPFKCNLCNNAAFASQSGLNYHIRLHSKIKNELTIIQKTREETVTSESEDENYYTLTDKSNGVTAEQSNTSINSLKCDDRVLKNEQEKINHKLDLPGYKLYQCSTCYKEFNSKTSLDAHKYVHLDEKPFKCDVCKKQFTTKRCYEDHKFYHLGTKPYRCNLCNNATFASRSGLYAHYTIHKYKGRFKCSYCEKTFPQKKDMQTHERFHTGEKPYQCDICGECFATSSKFCVHKRKHEGKGTHNCNYCNKIFYTKGGFDSHVVVHTGERPFVCNICNKAFSRKKTLICHEKIHSDVREYVCTICGAAFKQFPALRTHQKIHSKYK